MDPLTQSRNPGVSDRVKESKTECSDISENKMRISTHLLHSKRHEVHEVPNTSSRRSASGSGHVPILDLVRHILQMCDLALATR